MVSKYIWSNGEIRRQNKCPCHSICVYSIAVVLNNDPKHKQISSTLTFQQTNFDYWSKIYDVLYVKILSKQGGKTPVSMAKIIGGKNIIFQSNCAASIALIINILTQQHHKPPTLTFQTPKPDGCFKIYGILNINLLLK